MQLSFFIVDVFAMEKYTGNQLAVFPDAGALSHDDMLSLAREMHYSETTFITGEQQEDGGYPVRIFTPQEELPFAGHPTLGTAFVIHRFLRDNPTGEIRLNLDVGQIPVRVDTEQELLWMTQNPPEFGATIPPDTIADVLSIPRDDFDPNYPVQIVSTGIPFIIVPLLSIKAVQQCAIDHQYYPEALEGCETKALLVFAPETVSQENDIHARVFAEFYGVPEDPATGSANGCLAGYLSKYLYFNNPNIDIQVEQGIEILRPSLLRLRTSVTEQATRVQIGGRVIPVAEGNFF